MSLKRHRHNSADLLFVSPSSVSQHPSFHSNMAGTKRRRLGPKGHGKAARKAWKEAKSKRVQSVNMIERNVFGFPDKLIAPLRYHLSTAMTTTAGSIATYAISANSIFDPDRTAGGHQPLYRDTFNTIYNHYTVLGSKIKVIFSPNSTVGTYLVGLTQEDDTTVSAVADTLCEQSHSQHTLCNVSSGHPPFFKGYFGLEKTLEIDGYGSQSMKTNMGSDPAEEWFFIPFVIGQSGLTGIVTLDATIEYTVLFTELVTPTQS